ncbi:MAG: AI-2E family transporter [Clostridia bacterium]|nr:AI-2E family transporter [Clostridia bacterium]MDD4387290.1 AI-2E family transporter [Clostridia bacterium]
MKKEFNFRFLNKTMYLVVFIVLFYVCKNLGIIDKLLEINKALIPVYAGIMICFLSMPLANKLIKIGMGKKWAASISLIIIYGIIVGLFILIIPMFVEQLSKLITNFPDIYTKVVTTLNEFMHNNLGIDKSVNITTDINNLEFMKKYLANILTYSITTLQSVLGIIVSIFTTIVVSFFMVKDMEDFKKKTIAYFSNNGKNKARHNLIIDMDLVIMSYIKGIAIDSCIVGMLTAILCFVLKIDYAIIFGLLITVLNFIPYIGALLSEVIISLFALTIGGPMFALMTFLMLIVIQLIDANILQPNIVAKSVDLHPVVVFVGLIIGNLLMGIFGMIIVVPILAVIKIIIKYKSEKKNSILNSVKQL